MSRCLVAARNPGVLLIQLALLVGGPTPARGGADDRPVARAVWTPDPPRIDGRLDDGAWKAAPTSGSFVERRPLLGRRPPVRTTFRVLFDARALYVGVRCEDDRPAEIAAATRGRDKFEMFRDDAISIKVDAGHDHRSSLGFALNPNGARIDYRAINETEMRVEFDAVWQGAARRTASGWAAELRIPFVALGIDPHQPPERLGFNLTRDHARRSATYDWALLPPPFSAVAASRYGHLVGLVGLAQLARRVGGPADRPGPRTSGGTGYALVPYILGGFRRERAQIEDEAGALTEGALDTDGVIDGGLDALLLHRRWRGQLTINTDFAQVDLDQQVANLTRFGLFLPEKRDFFLREIELFAFGRPEQAQLLHTRRIGLRQGQEVPIVGGLKLVGRPLQWLRLGLLQVVTRPAVDLPWTSDLVARGVVELPHGSNVGVMLTHRQSLEQRGDHNLVVGVDGAWRGARTPLLLEGFALVALTGARAAEPAEAVGAAGTDDHPSPGGALSLSWRGRLVRPQLRYAYYHPDLRTDLGFFRRVGVHEGSASLVVEPRIERLGLEKIAIEGFGGVVADAPARDLLDANGGGRLGLYWDAGLIVELWGERLSETVREAFELGPQTTIAAGQYTMSRFTVDAETPSTWPVSLTGGFTLRDYYGGRLLGVAAEVSARPLPLLRFSLAGGVDHARFDDARRNFRSAILNGNVGLAFTRDLVLDLAFFWNDLQSLLRGQARVRWTWASGSDLYLVYQHDVDQAAARTRFQSLLLKATYRWSGAR